MKTIATAVRQEGIGAESLRRWVVQANIDAGDRDGQTSEEHTEIRRLKAENRRLRDDVAILKAAMSFFVGELDPRRDDARADDAGGPVRAGEDDRADPPHPDR